MNYSIKTISGWAVLLLMIIQFIPLRRINPPVYSDLHAPATVKSSLKKGCYDCHSNETEWPNAAYIAPVSWFMDNSVASGRNVLNFSVWNNKKSAETVSQTIKISKTVSALPAHQKIYYTLRPEKRLTESEKSAVLNWLDSLLKTGTPVIKN